MIPAVDRHPSRGSDSVRVPPGGWRTLRQPPVCIRGWAIGARRRTVVRNGAQWRPADIYLR
ncbi:hypothetical protein F8277_02875 [Bifidobacterium longum subsp. infantis]|uniref:Uncharacterized protein n=2 Tax=Bifidobacterium longum TaxID=216816 RepID=A0A4S5BEA5_BIFLI|nr:hypothetical protein HMPREF1314_1589 [Bifidobacterium longum subsp. longum 35B]EIJ27647.1 hypothetical protein HMPREF1315_1778 [Bifidobacterium longum subsp. longum 2-2B]KAB1945086.1 hypothetical protein F8277_02875 [Bifidobacterium longum subsp. infantis]PKY77804.1 hypothetical protein CYJ39_00625 [Bifidobacterium longum]MED7619476.1 hypothetical protein [Bifidobacterium longum subsp. infantis]